MTTYTCDICGKKIKTGGRLHIDVPRPTESHDWMFTVSVIRYVKKTSAEQAMDVCLECVQKNIAAAIPNEP